MTKKVLITEKCKIGDEEYEPGQTYEFDDNVADKMVEEGYGNIQPEIEGPEELEEAEEETEEEQKGENKEEKSYGIPEELEKFLRSRGFSPGADNNKWSKTVEVNGKEVNLIRDFERTPKGAKMAINANTDKSMSEVAEDHPDMKYFTMLRDGDISLEEAVTRAENESNKEKRDKGVADIADEMEGSGTQLYSKGQGQKMEVKLEPAMKLDNEEAVGTVEKDMIEGLDREDLEALVWDPEEEDVPYDRPTASAEAYDLFARIVEMALGVQYSEDEVVFRETEDTYECDITIVRESPDPRYAGKIMKGYKTRSKNKTSGKDHWRERLKTKARRNALKSEIPKTWISRLLKRYKDVAP